MKTKTSFTFAGNGRGNHLDGYGTNAILCGPYAIALHKDRKRLFVSEDSDIIRQIDISPLTSSTSASEFSFNTTNMFKVQTLCGKPTTKGFADGIGKIARFSSPSGLAFSRTWDDTLFVCDSLNDCIRKVDVSCGIVTTLSGSVAQPGYLDGISNTAKFNYLKGICVDEEDNIYVCDTNNHAIRKVDSYEGSVTTLMRDPKFKFPAFVVYDNKSKSLIFTHNHAVSKIRLPRTIFTWQLKRLFRIHRLLSRHIENEIWKRLLLELISFAIAPIEENKFKSEEQKKRKKVIQYARQKSTLQNAKRLRMAFLTFVFDQIKNDDE